MRKLLAGFILIMVLPITGQAQTPNQVQGTEALPGRSTETTPSGSKPLSTFPERNNGAVNKQSEAYASCVRATQRFDQQEKAKGNPKVDVTSLSTACEEQLKPAEYWQCMEKEAAQNVDFNTAHGRCGRQHNIR